MATATQADDQIGAAVDVHFAEDRAHLVRDGALRDAPNRGDVAIAEAVDEQSGYLPLRCGQGRRKSLPKAGQAHHLKVPLSGAFRPYLRGPAVAGGFEARCPGGLGSQCQGTQTQFLHGTGPVSGDGRHGQPHSVGYQLVRCAAHDQVEHLPLSVGEATRTAAGASEHISKRARIDSV
jgi:hypothetical protein